MDKAEEIFAEGIEDRNVKTIRQARVLFVICLMAGMFIIFESGLQCWLFIFLQIRFIRNI